LKQGEGSSGKKKYGKKVNTRTAGGGGEAPKKGKTNREVDQVKDE